MLIGVNSTGWFSALCVGTAEICLSLRLVFIFNFDENCYLFVCEYVCLADKTGYVSDNIELRLKSINTFVSCCYFSVKRRKGIKHSIDWIKVIITVS